MRISQHSAIDAPAARVWEYVGPGFATIGEWASGVPRSEPIDEGRVCTVAGAPGIDRVTERLTAYDDTARTLAYEAEGMPGFVDGARNSWRIEATGPATSRAAFDAQLDMSGIWRIIAPLLGLRIGMIGRRSLRELKHVVEQGRPARRKQRQLERDTQMAELAAATPGSDGGRSLRAAVGANANLSAVCAAVLVVGGFALSGPFGVDGRILTALGAALAAGVGLLRWLIARPRQLAGTTPIILAADVAWIMTALWLIVFSPTGLTALGKIALGTMSLGVAIIAIAQARGLQQLTGRARLLTHATGVSWR